MNESSENHFARLQQYRNLTNWAIRPIPYLVCVKIALIFFIFLFYFILFYFFFFFASGFIKRSHLARLVVIIHLARLYLTIVS